MDSSGRAGRKRYKRIACKAGAGQRPLFKRSSRGADEKYKAIFYKLKHRKNRAVKGGGWDDEGAEKFLRFGI